MYVCDALLCCVSTRWTTQCQTNIRRLPRCLLLGFFKSLDWSVTGSRNLCFVRLAILLTGLMDILCSSTKIVVNIALSWRVSCSIQTSLVIPVIPWSFFLFSVRGCVRVFLREQEHPYLSSVFVVFFPLFFFTEEVLDSLKDGLTKRRSLESTLYLFKNEEGQRSLIPQSSSASWDPKIGCNLKLGFPEMLYLPFFSLFPPPPSLLPVFLV